VSTADAARQLNICNSCRYCEGYCAVFPALERRSTLSDGDLVHLANLCHDCRACLYACMYSPPHEFGVNIPLALSEVRVESFAALAGSEPSSGERRSKVLSVIVIFAATVLVLAYVLTRSVGIFETTHSAPGYPYRVIAYPLLLGIMLAASCWAVAVIGRSVIRYCRTTGLKFKSLFDPRVVLRAFGYAATLHYSRGGGEECYYDGTEPSSARRLLHSFMAYGFLACLASTIAAAVLQDLMGSHPPYAILSVPVVFGVLGGAGLLIGSSGLVFMKRRADPAAEVAGAVAADFALLWALDVLSLSGIATLVLRNTALFPWVLLIHLTAILAGILLVPFSKFPHFLYRVLALVKDVEEDEEQAPTSVG
jgi:citrate/tricarballylate utilization protein